MSGSVLAGRNWTTGAVRAIQVLLCRTLLFVACSVGVLVAFSSQAWAQQGVINLDETVIKGRIQKPEAFYILQHANLNYEALDPKPTFIPELLKTVKEEPF